MNDAQPIHRKPHHPPPHRRHHHHSEPTDPRAAAGDAVDPAAPAPTFDALFQGALPRAARPGSEPGPGGPPNPRSRGEASRPDSAASTSDAPSAEQARSRAEEPNRVSGRGPSAAPAVLRSVRGAARERVAREPGDPLAVTSAGSPSDPTARPTMDATFVGSNRAEVPGDGASPGDPVAGSSAGEAGQSPTASVAPSSDPPARRGSALDGGSATFDHASPPMGTGYSPVAAPALPPAPGSSPAPGAPRPLANPAATVPNQVVQQLTELVRQGNLNATLVLRLEPPDLGAVILRVSARNGQRVCLRFEVEHAGAGEALSRGKDQIEHFLRASGLNPETVSVDLVSSFAGWSDGTSAGSGAGAGLGGDGAGADPRSRSGERGSESAAAPTRAGRDSAPGTIVLSSAGRLVDYRL